MLHTGWMFFPNQAPPTRSLQCPLHWRVIRLRVCNKTLICAPHLVFLSLCTGMQNCLWEHCDSQGEQGNMESNVDLQGSVFQSLVREPLLKKTSRDCIFYALHFTTDSKQEAHHHCRTVITATRSSPQWWSGCSTTPHDVLKSVVADLQPPFWSTWGSEMGSFDSPHGFLLPP